MTQNPQRFSGPELAALLSQVRDQLGEDATIVEANRLRQGGFAGFFARQHFEVLATPHQAHSDATVADEPAGSDPRLRAGGHIDSLLDRAEQVSSAERAAPAADLDRFSEVLRAALVETPIEVDEVAPRSPIASTAAAPAMGPAPTIPTVVGPEPTAVPPLAGAASPVPPLTAAAASPVPPLAAATAPSGHVTHPAPASFPPPAQPPERPPVAAVVDHGLACGGDAAGTGLWPASGARRRRTPPPSHVRAARDLATLPAGGFWSRLLRFEQLLDDSPLDAPVTVLVGPVDDAVAVARAVSQAGGIDPVDLVVVSEAPVVDGVPPWQLVGREADVAQRVAYWRSNGRPAVVVVELADQLGWTRDMVQAASGGVTRLVVRSLDDAHHLAATLRALPPVAALDLTRPPAPELLVPLVEHGVRIATVCGRPLTPMLLAGLTGTMDHG